MRALSSWTATPSSSPASATARAVHDPAADFYIDALTKLQDSGIPFLVGGAFAFSHYSQVPRDTKDIDVFVKPEDCPRVLRHFDRLGYETFTPFPHWLGKISRSDHFMRSERGAPASCWPWCPITLRWCRPGRGCSHTAGTWSAGCCYRHGGMLAAACG